MKQLWKDIMQHTEGKRILFAGVGNVLKHDDGVGVYISQHILKTEKHNSLAVEVSIENYIGKINSIAPDILVIIDAVDFNQPPGYFDLVSVNGLIDTTTNTHNISLRQLEALFHMPVYILGIQPADVSFGEGLSVAVRQTADELINTLNPITMQKEYV